LRSKKLIYYLGPFVSILDEELIKWVEEKRRKAIPLNYSSLENELRSISRSMSMKSKETINSWIQRFNRRHGLVFRRVSHKSSLTPESIKSTCEKFIVDTQEKIKIIRIKSADNILNMDESCIIINKMLPHTLDFRGTTEIWSLAGKNSKEKLTMIFAITMSGIKLPIMFIGKGKPNKQKERKIQKYINLKRLEVLIKMNDKSWMNQGVMND
jgi:hypothetical protein